jgi:hypothetical protein
MSTRDDYLIAIASLVPGELPLDEADRIVAINNAMLEHSRHRPRVVVEDMDGDGGFDYELSELAAWSEGFSVIKSVEYPVDDDDRTPNILQDDEWRIYEKPDGKRLRFLTGTPAATEDFRVTYTAPHTCTDTACTAQAGDEMALQMLVAACYCDLLATYYTQQGDSTIGADVVDHKSKASEYEARANRYRKSYFNHFGIREGDTPPASVTADQDVLGSWGADRVTHKQRYR